jgi:peroxiredoxin
MPTPSRNRLLFWLILIALPLLSIAAALLVLLLTDSRSPETVTQANASPTAYTHPLIGQMAPNFELAALDGDTVRLSSLRGRVVFLNFWATWCEPCRREFPAFESFGAQQSDAVILTINQGETPEQVTAFLEEIGVADVPVLLDSDFQVGDGYATDYFPVTFVIDPAGVVRDFHLGEITQGDLTAYTAALLPKNNG